MDASRNGGLETGAELVQAQAELWNHVFAYTRSMSLRCAVELGIPDAVHRHGGAATVPELVAALSLPPSRAPYLRRLMRLLAHAGFFSFDDAAAGYGLTPLSRLLVCSPGAGGQDLSPFALAMLHPVIVSPSMSLASWFRATDARNAAARVPFDAAHGRDFWAVAKDDREFGAAFNDAMACDGRFVTDVLVRDHSYVFRGLASLVDVGGGSGGAARAIAAAFPHVRCSVLELPHVVASVPPGERGGVEFVAGDMFEHVPKADAVLLKWILHGWDDEECVRILRRCREAIPTKDSGRVIVMDLVVGSSPADERATETQLLWDVMMMGVVGSPERDEREWRKIFEDAGFSGYKIVAVLGIRSVIEVYP
ncbi:trans-resveratrol di-O-methyltransferase-like [Phragmites australis]|uniref:trans-resveratrol di-O-methyltransferase-like n=1 Tax=Phragmites australis TaxID=29695 RepID=UPI002D788D2C|nr:trans-resveratrol di-O-methyltransferase-like [Phragmites australis]